MVIAIIGILIALLLPAVQAAREAARRSQCTNNLKQLGLGVHNYADVTKKFPARSSGTTGTNTNGGWLSGFIPLLPYIEQGPMYDRISAGPPPFGVNTEQSWPGFWDVAPTVLQCPSDGGKLDPTGAMELSIHNYAFSGGDDYVNLDGATAANTRGVFGWGFWYDFADISDGTSNTAMFSERLRQGNAGAYSVGAGELDHRLGQFITGSMDSGYPPLLCMGNTDGKYFIPGSVVRRFGNRFADGSWRRCAFNTVLPPNAPACADSGGRNGACDALVPPSSQHPGGVNVCLCDGSVRFISETIDTGDLSLEQSNSHPGRSRYGVWGSLGSKDGGEAVTPN